MNTENYLILSPALDQSAFFSRLLRLNRPGASIIGVAMPGERIRFRRGFDRVVQLAEVEEAKLEGTLIPTGAASTGHLLQKGPIRLGSVTMSPDALGFFDKPWSLKQALSAGIASPETFDRVPPANAFPVFYKPALEGASSLRGVARTAAEIPSAPEGSLIFQELIVSPGTYGVCFIAENGKLQASFSHFEAESQPSFGGSAVVIERCTDSRLEAHAKRLVEASGFSGWGLVEFKFCPRRNDYVFMEVNAKFWASCEFAFINEPRFARLLFGIEMEPKRLDRMVFAGRAFARGFGALPLLAKALKPGTGMRLYPSWPAMLATGLMPPSLKAAVKRLRRKQDL